jgi:uncharacterized protein (TIGR02145 family)
MYSKRSITIKKNNKMKNIILLLFILILSCDTKYLAQTVRIGNIEVSTSDVPGLYTKEEALNYLQSQPNWRLPTIEELQLIYENQNALTNLRYGYNDYLASGNQNNFKFHSGGSINGWSEIWALEFANGRWVKPDHRAKLCLRLVKSDNSNQDISQVDKMFCSSGNCDEGFGTMIFPKNSGFKEYTGTWKKGYRDRYGNFIKCINLECRFVKGKLTYIDGSIYNGSFDSDGSGQYQGYGHFYKPNGTYEKGDFFKGFLNGFGEEKKSDGIIYNGRFIEGVRQGKCTMTYPSGEVVKGRYWERKFISEKNDLSNAKFDNSIIGLNPSDKKEYFTILNNGKEWMTENLNVITFRNGDQINQAKTEQDLLDASINKQPVWCYYAFNPATETNYGKLYNFYAINDSRGLLPLGYIIPSMNDWQSVNNFDIFKNTGGRAQLNQSEGKEVGSGKINKRYFFVFENGPSKEKKYDEFSGAPINELGFYWTTDIYQDQYNDRINVFAIGADGKTQTDSYQRKGACVSVRGLRGDHNYYEGSWTGNLKSGNGTEYYGVKTDLKGYGTVSKGDKYTGLWQNGQQNGEGTIILSDGSRKTGFWKEGEFIGEWKLFDNRHKCNHCNIKMAQSTKRTDNEISQLKKEANSNEIGLFNNKLYCSSACELKVAAERKALEKQYAKESKSRESQPSTPSSGSIIQQSSNPLCGICNRTIMKPYADDKCGRKDKEIHRPGYILCSSCNGWGYLQAFNGNRWCYDRDCPAISCDDGWQTCHNCIGKGFIDINQK